MKPLRKNSNNLTKRTKFYLMKRKERITILSALLTAMPVSVVLAEMVALVGLAILVTFLAISLVALAVAELVPKQRLKAKILQ